MFRQLAVICAALTLCNCDSGTAEKISHEVLPVLAQLLQLRQGAEQLARGLKRDLPRGAVVNKDNTAVEQNYTAARRAMAQYFGALRACVAVRAKDAGDMDRIASQTEEAVGRFVASAAPKSAPARLPFRAIAERLKGIPVSQRIEIVERIESETRWMAWEVL